MSKYGYQDCVICGQVEWEHLDPAGEGYCHSMHAMLLDDDAPCVMCPTPEEQDRVKPITKWEVTRDSECFN